MNRPPVPPTATELALWRQREEELDLSGMRELVAGFGERLAAAVDPALRFVTGFGEAARPTAIAVLGMGGSAVGGDLAAAVTEPESTIPLAVVRSWDPPGWVDARALVIASSYSGETEETLAAYRVARERGARGVAIAAGGRLPDLARELGDPVFDLPPGLPPRAALPESLAATLLAVAALDPAFDVATLAEELKAVGAGLVARSAEWMAWEIENPALDLAVACADRLPVIHGAHPVSIAAAGRWKTQLNENAKLPAWTAAFPEHGHNEIVGYEGRHPVLEHLALLYLETPWDDPRASRRMEWTRRWCSGRVGAQHRVESGGETLLDSMLRLCCLGDCTSFLASIITGRDPTPVASIDQLKTETAR